MVGIEWSVPSEWKGETVFIIGGGPSVSTQPIERLKGRHVIVINSSYEVFPEADYLYTMDCRWLKFHRAILQNSFKGKIVTNSKSAGQLDWPELHLLKKVPPPGLATDPRYTSGLRTSMHGAINLACHLTGWKGKIILLGADGGMGPNGKTHHHTNHPWRSRPGCWDEQLKDLKTILPVLKEHGIEVLNASPGTRWPIFPITDLETVLASEMPVPALVLGNDIKKIGDFILHECQVPWKLEKFITISSGVDLKHAIPFLGRGVKWYQLGHVDAETAEKVRSLFGPMRTREDFILAVRK